MMKKIVTIILLLAIATGIGCKGCTLGQRKTDFEMGKGKIIDENKPLEAIPYLEETLKKDKQDVKARCYLMIACRRAENDVATKIKGDKEIYIEKGRQELEKLRQVADQAVEELLAIMRNSKAGRIRRDAMQIVADLGAPAATPLVDAYIEYAKIRYVQEGYRGLHNEIIEMLTRMGSAATPSLAKALDDANTPIMVRREIARILGDIGDAKAQEHLKKHLNATDSGLKMEAAIALYKLNNKQHANTIIAGLSDPNVSARRAAARALVTMNESPTEKLIKTLNDQDCQVRIYAAKALGKHPKKQTIDPLIKAIKRESFRITQQSLEHLRSEDVPDDVLGKLKSLKNQEVTGKEKFLHKLKETIGEEQTDRFKSSILKHADENDAFKNTIAEALTEIGDKHGKYIVEVLVKELGVMTDWKVRSRVVSILSNPSVIRHFDQDTAYLLYTYQDKEDNPTVKGDIDKLLNKLDERGI